MQYRALGKLSVLKRNVDGIIFNHATMLYYFLYLYIFPSIEWCNVYVIFFFFIFFFIFYSISGYVEYVWRRYIGYGTG